mmetsp:Transcript_27212/g.50809  ORF Transcript_27212/g.50809 Transcript_27212/m.50809 type:complete len:210 (+) Transcript_27212:979-1608(+)
MIFLEDAILRLEQLLSLRHEDAHVLSLWLLLKAIGQTIQGFHALAHHEVRDPRTEKVKLVVECFEILPNGLRVFEGCPKDSFQRSCKHRLPDEQEKVLFAPLILECGFDNRFEPWLHPLGQNRHVFASLEVLFIKLVNRVRKFRSLYGIRVVFKRLGTHIARYLVEDKVFSLFQDRGKIKRIEHESHAFSRHVQRKHIAVNLLRFFGAI